MKTLSKEFSGQKPGRAVITGASCGLGRAFALELASRGWELELASLPGTGLPLLVTELRARGVKAHGSELDLTDRTGRMRFMQEVSARKDSLDLLVNNAGIGQNGLFDLLPLEPQMKAIELNILSTVDLTYAMIPLLGGGKPEGERTPPGRILNVASLAAFYPMPLFAIYSSTKAFLLHWSLALRNELGETGIGVTVLAPGGMYTSPEIRAKVRSQGLGGRLSTMEPAVVARIALDAAFRNRAMVIPGVFNKLLWLAGSKAPRNFVAAAIHKRWKSALAKVQSPASVPEFAEISTREKKPA